MRELPQNEPVLTYATGTPERAELKKTLASMSSQTIEITSFIGGSEVRTGELRDVRAPHRHDLLLARCHEGGAKEATRAIDAALGAWPASSRTPLAERVEVLVEAGLPAGVINMVHGSPPEIAATVLARPELAGVHFTGSTDVFRGLWRTVGERIATYRSFPRLVGETGGKDFVFAHPSADVDALAVALARGAFEFQGQKCSAASRLYVPASLYPRVKERLTALIGEIRLGD